MIYVSGYVTLQQVPKHQVKVKKSNTKQGSLEVLKKQIISSNRHSAVIPTKQVSVLMASPLASKV